MKWAWFSLASVAVLVVLLVGGWMAGEMRYSNCLESADLRYPVAYKQPLQGGENQFIGPEAEPGEFDYAAEASRKEALSACSRWP